MKIIKWSTPLSDCSDLYSESIAHEAGLTMNIVDETGVRFRVYMANPGPYRVYHEQYLSEYWSGHISKDLRWTFVVEGGDWDSLVPEWLDVYLLKRTDYVISTEDLCLEVLARDEPVVDRL